MAQLKILLYPDPVLRKKSAPISKIDSGVRILLDDMLETMRAANGIGLSAPQVGRNVRVVIVSDARGFEEPPQDGEEEREAEEPAGEEKVEMPVIEMINPAAGTPSGRDYQVEGCLSIPNFLAKVGRSKSVEVEWLCREGKKHRMLADGLTARIIQHEIDHLDGVLFVDRLSGLKKEMMLKKMEKAFGSESGGGDKPGHAPKKKKGA
ncbi:MAG: peptide deformylase [Thermodesulfobacteriota bacterium]